MRNAVSGLILAACLLVYLAGCKNEERPRSGAGSAAQKISVVSLVDPFTWRAESDFFSADSGVHYRVEVVTDAGVDTVPDVLVLDQPVISPDSLSVFGVALEPHNIVQGIFSYSPITGTLNLNTTPGPGYSPYSEPELSPDGLFLAYLANDRNYHFWLVVALWPGAEVVVQTPQVQTSCTEFWGNALRWVSADSLELYMNLCQQDTWARASGKASTREFLVDTVGIDVLEALRASWK